MNIQGSITALATPFLNGEVDEDAYRRLVTWQIAEGTHGLVPVGTTGESPTVSMQEHKDLVRITVEEAKGRVFVIAGTGSNSTHEAIELTKDAEKVGADAALVVVPYYNKPTQEGMYAHFSAVAQSTRLPIILYNVPGRTAASISAETVARLAKDHTNIIGIKDATADLVRPLLQRHLSGEHFIQLSGEDATALAFNVSGGVGAISVTSNVAPKLCALMQEACLRGDFKEALSLQEKLFPLHQALFVETSPAPVKYALHLLGIGTDEVRLPLVPLSSSARKTVEEAMAFAGLL